MLDRIKKMLGLKGQTDYKTLVNEGAKIIDVRTPAEYSSGHIKGSINIPLRDLNKRIGIIRQDQQVILCCASGARSSSALQTLRSMGYTKVCDGGGWSRLKARIN